MVREKASSTRRNDESDQSAHPTLQNSVPRLPKTNGARRRKMGKYPLPPSYIGSAVTTSGQGAHAAAAKTFLNSATTADDKATNNADAETAAANKTSAKTADESAAVALTTSAPYRTTTTVADGEAVIAVTALANDFVARS
jgi:hypothetical protein